MGYLCGQYHYSLTANQYHRDLIDQSGQQLVVSDDYYRVNTNHSPSQSYSH